MTQIKTPKDRDWNTLNELKLIAGRDAASAQEYNDFLGMFDWSDYTYKENNKTGVKNIFEKVIIPPLFDDVITLSNAVSGYRYLVAIVELTGKYALVLRDGSGGTLTPFIYDEIEEIGMGSFLRL